MNYLPATLIKIIGKSQKVVKRHIFLEIPTKIKNQANLVPIIIGEIKMNVKRNKKPRGKYPSQKIMKFAKTLIN